MNHQPGVGVGNGIGIHLQSGIGIGMSVLMEQYDSCKGKCAQIL